MKTIVLYVSKTGNTEAYAKDLASRVEGEALPLKKFKWKKQLADYDCIVFGGWSMGGKIQGVDKFLSHYDEMHEAGKDIIIFSTGISYPTPEGRKQMISINLLDLYRVRYYQIRGSFDMNKLRFPYKQMMGAMLRKTGADPNLDANKQALVELLDRPLEVYDTEKVEKIANRIKLIAEERAKKEA